MGQATPARLPSADAMVRDLYGSLSEDVSFLPGLQRMAHAFGSHFTCLHHEELALGRGRIDIVGELGAAEYARISADYSARWIGNNLWVERSPAVLLAKGWASGDDLVGERELRQSEYYQHFLRPVDVRHGLGISVHSQGAGYFAIVSFNRSAIAGDFDEGERTLVDALRPHLVNAYTISRRLRLAREDAATLRASFDQLPLGMLVLEADGRVATCNAEATRLLGEARGIQLGACGRLVLAGAATRARLQAALAHLADPGQPPMPEVILVSAAGVATEDALVLHLCALPATAGLAVRGRILAFLSPVSRPLQARIASRILQLAFDLTPAEATVTLALREHHDPLHVALELGLAISTVRSHLKHVFAKTGTGSQRALLRLVDCLLAGVRD
jgi:DNA-binding CsgD family transcriptional regulator/PAS domain-containing protein